MILQTITLQYQSHFFFRLNKLKWVWFPGHIGQRETSRVGVQDVMPSCWTHKTQNIISDQWNRSTLSCYNTDRLFLPPRIPCQSRERPTWVIHSPPRVSQCHVARKWHINAANHVATIATRATVRASTHMGSGCDAYRDPTAQIPIRLGLTRLYCQFLHPCFQ